MAKQTINLGTVANDGTGDSVRAGGDKVNNNFNEIYAALGDGTSLNDVVTNTTFQNTLANTNAHISAVETREAVHTANALSQLANTNAYIGAVEIREALHTSNALSQLANTNAYIASVQSAERAALANTNSYIASTAALFSNGITTGTTNQIAVSANSTNVVISLDSPLVFSGNNTTGISSFNITDLLSATPSVTIDAIRHDNTNVAGDATKNFSPALRIRGTERQARILFDGGQEMFATPNGDFEIQSSTSSGSLDIGIGFKTTTGDDRNTTSTNKIRAHSRMQIEAHNTTSGAASAVNTREAALIITGIRDNTDQLGGQQNVDWSPALRIRGYGRQARITFDGGSEIVGGTSSVMNLEGSIQINGVTQSGSDYAEYFETYDGSAIANGIPVILIDGKIRAANTTSSTNDIIGVIRPPRSSSAVGGSDLGEWHNKYLKTVWGNHIRTDDVFYTWTTWAVNEQGQNRPTEHKVTSIDDIPSGQEYQRVENFQKIINPEYDETLEYQTREERPEWQIVGLLGQVQILSGSPTNPRWIKMRNIDDDHELWYIR